MQRNRVETICLNLIIKYVFYQVLTEIHCKIKASATKKETVSSLLYMSNVSYFKKKTKTRLCSVKKTQDKGFLFNLFIHL